MTVPRKIEQNRQRLNDQLGHVFDHGLKLFLVLVGRDARKFFERADEVGLVRIIIFKSDIGKLEVFAALQLLE
jgi:hypothetical protein